MPKRKPVNYKLVPRFGDEGEEHEAYRLLDTLIRQHHVHLLQAKIAIAWRYGWKPDKDGRLKLGQMKKASDLDRDLHPYDFVMLLNFEVWHHEKFPLKKKLYVIDHEATHGQIEFDSSGEFKKDERGRVCYRLRGHDVEEFTEITERHGIQMQNVEQFARAILLHSKVVEQVGRDKANAPLLAPVMTVEPLPEDGDLPWYKRPVTALKLSGKVVRALQMSGLLTLGALNFYLAQDRELRSVDGIDGAAGAIRDALARLKPEVKDEKGEADARHNS